MEAKLCYPLKIPKQAKIWGMRCDKFNENCLNDKMYHSTHYCQSSRPKNSLGPKITPLNIDGTVILA